MNIENDTLINKDNLDTFHDNLLIKKKSDHTGKDDDKVTLSLTALEPFLYDISVSGSALNITKLSIAQAIAKLSN